MIVRSTDIRAALRSRQRGFFTMPGGIGISGPRRNLGPYGNAVLADNPLVYLRLSDTSGTTAADSSGYGRHFTYAGGFTLGAAGALSGTNADTTGVTFNGSTGHAERAVTDLAFNGLTAFTIEAWIKTSGANGMIFCMVDVTNGNALPRMFLLDVNASKLRGLLRVTNGLTAATITSAANVNNNAWRHVLFRRNTAGTAGEVWIDGAFAMNGTLPSGAINFAATDYAQVGRFRPATGSPSLYFNGSIDEFAFYGVYLTDARIAAHYDARAV